MLQTYTAPIIFFILGNNILVLIFYISDKHEEFAASFAQPDISNKPITGDGVLFISNDLLNNMWICLSSDPIHPTIIQQFCQPTLTKGLPTVSSP